MNHETPFFIYLLLSYCVVDISAMLVGAIRLTFAVKNHPLYTATITTSAEMDEAKKIIFGIIDEKMYLPHHKMCMKRSMEDTIEKEKKKM